MRFNRLNFGYTLSSDVVNELNLSIYKLTEGDFGISFFYLFFVSLLSGFTECDEGCSVFRDLFSSSVFTFFTFYDIIDRMSNARLLALVFSSLYSHQFYCQFDSTNNVHPSNSICSGIHFRFEIHECTRGHVSLFICYASNSIFRFVQLFLRC